MPVTAAMVDELAAVIAATAEVPVLRDDTPALYAAEEDAAGATEVVAEE
jgi:hypothetical protein